MPQRKKLDAIEKPRRISWDSSGLFVYLDV